MRQETDEDRGRVRNLCPGTGSNGKGGRTSEVGLETKFQCDSHRRDRFYREGGGRRYGVKGSNKKKNRKS